MAFCNKSGSRKLQDYSVKFMRNYATDYSTVVVFFYRRSDLGVTHLKYRFSTNYMNTVFVKQLRKGLFI